MSDNPSPDGFLALLTAASRSTASPGNTGTAAAKPKKKRRTKAQLAADLLVEAENTARKEAQKKAEKQVQKQKKEARKQAAEQRRAAAEAEKVAKKEQQLQKKAEKEKQEEQKKVEREKKFVARVAYEQQMIAAMRQIEDDYRTRDDRTPGFLQRTAFFLMSMETVKESFTALKDHTVEKIDADWKTLTQNCKAVMDLCAKTGGGGVLDQLGRKNIDITVYNELITHFKDNPAFNAIGGGTAGDDINSEGESDGGRDENNGGNDGGGVNNSGCGDDGEQQNACYGGYTSRVLNPSNTPAVNKRRRSSLSGSSAKKHSVMEDVLKLSMQSAEQTKGLLELMVKQSEARQQKQDEMQLQQQQIQLAMINAMAGIARFAAAPNNFMPPFQ
ncbi:hypothetical protein HDU76_003935 [Blyttiomyces sp. JEL0837]|nr:hypothetical protein HDU76_003935 [Blyttiomyces sp. JEL0837]